MIQKLFSLYTELVPQSPWLTVGGLYERRLDDFAALDVRRFIQFGVVKGLLRRVHRYVFRQEASVSELTQFVPPHMLRGQHSTDEICCLSNLTSRALDELIESDPFALVYYH
mgnify:CR=1 FL=1